MIGTLPAHAYRLSAPPVFETNDAIFVIVGDQAQQLTEAEQLTKLPRLDERQACEALQELGVAEIMAAPDSK